MKTYKYKNLIDKQQIPDDCDKFLCDCYKLTELPILPNTLKILNCSGNILTNLPILPSTLIKLYCSYNEIIVLPKLPNSLNILSCGSNNIIEILELPINLTIFDCSSCKIIQLPSIFPSKLKKIIVCFNELTELPELPERIKMIEIIDCCYNNIKYLSNHNVVILKKLLQYYIIELMNANTLISFDVYLLNNPVSINYTNNEDFINSFE